jgi:hypothetical protein
MNDVDNERPAFAGLSLLERTGIDPVTSGLQRHASTAVTGQSQCK